MLESLKTSPNEPRICSIAFPSGVSAVVITVCLTSLKVLHEIRNSMAYVIQVILTTPGN